MIVRERGDAVATFRHVSVYLMETLAQWVPTSPELEAKAHFGRHLWELAQHADAFGKRTAELRLALHQSRAPTAAYATVLVQLAAIGDTPGRIAGFYDLVLPHLERRYKRYLEETDALLDEPTIRVVERALTDFARMARERDALFGERPDLRDGDPGALAGALDDVSEIVDFRPPAPAATGT